MTAVSAPRPGWELLAEQVNQRRYEALRAYLYEGASLAQAAGRVGYTRAALASLVRDLRAGKLTVFAPPGVPGRKSAPEKDAARARVIELRREGLSVDEISTRLTRDGTPLGRSAVSDILREEGFGRLLRGPAPEASTSPATSGRDTRLPAAAVTDFAALPARVHTTMAGLLLAIPDLVALDLPALAARPATPGARRSRPPATCWPSSSPPPGACPTSMTCLLTRLPRCSRACWLRRLAPAPTTPGPGPRCSPPSANAWMVPVRGRPPMCSAGHWPRPPPATCQPGRAGSHRMYCGTSAPPGSTSRG